MPASFEPRPSSFERALDPGSTPRSREPGRRLLRLLPLPVALLLTTGCATQVSTRPFQVHVVDKNDSNQRDEPYFGVISFVSTFGVPGSTRVTRHERMPAPRVEEDETVEVPDRDGIGSFRRVSRVKTAASASAGVSLVGQIVVTMESDDVGWDPALRSGLRDVLDRRRNCLELSLRERVEGGDPAARDLASTLVAIGDDLEGRIPAAEEGTRDTPLCFEPRFRGGGGAIFDLFERLVRLFVNPDDPMGSIFVVTVVVDQAYFDEIGILLPCAPFERAAPTRERGSAWASVCPFPFGPTPRELVFESRPPEGRHGRWEVTVRVQGRLSFADLLRRLFGEFDEGT